MDGNGNALVDYLGPATTFSDRFWPSPQTMNKVTNTGYEASGILMSFFKSDAGIGISIAVALILLLTLLLRSSSKSSSTGESLEMRKWERERQLKNLVGDEFTDRIEDLYFKNLISKGEKRELYRRLETVFQSDQFRHQKHPARKKAEIRARTNGGVHKPVTIPGDPPPQLERREPKLDTVKPVRPRGMISKIIAASKAASL